MADQNLRINISATNQSGQTFQQVRQDFDKLKMEILKPIEGPRIKPRFDDASQSARDRNAGQLRGLRRAADANDQRIVNARNQPGYDLTANEFARENSDRLRSRQQASGSPGGREHQSFEDAIHSAFLFKAAEKTAKTLENLAKAGEDYRQALKEGQPKMAAFGKTLFDAIPIVDTFAAAGRQIRAFVDELRDPSKFDRQRKKDDAQDQREEKQKIIDRRNANRDKITADAAGAVAGSRDELGLVGKQGDALARAQADQEFRKAQEKAAAIRASAGAFSSTEEQNKIKAQANQLEENASKVHQQKLYDISRGAYDKEFDLNRSHNLDLAGADSSLAQAQLTLQGKVFTAKLEAIKAQNAKEVAEARDKRDKEQEELIKGGASTDDPRFGAADKRFQESKARSDAKAAGEAATAKQQEDVDRINQEREAQDKITDLRTQAQAERLRNSGQGEAADRLLRKESLDRQIEDIQKNYDEQARLHAERIPELAKDRDALIAAARDKAAADEEQAVAQNAEKFRIKGPEAFKGESRLLTGVGSTQDPMLEATSKTAQASVTRVLQGTKLQTTMELILTELQGSGQATMMAEAV